MQANRQPEAAAVTTAAKNDRSAPASLLDSMLDVLDGSAVVADVHTHSGTLLSDSALQAIALADIAADPDAIDDIMALINSHPQFKRKVRRTYCRICGESGCGYSPVTVEVEV